MGSVARGTARGHRLYEASAPARGGLSWIARYDIFSKASAGCAELVCGLRRPPPGKEPSRGVGADRAVFRDESTGGPAGEGRRV